MQYSEDGANVSPPLQWSGVPPETKTLALIVDDPDAPDPAAPKRTWVHWVVVDLPAQVDHLDESASRHAMPPGAREGRNDWKKVGYGGPAPPVGRHRYIHKLYALDCSLSDLREPTKQELEDAMRGHVLAEARLVGTYARAR